MTTRSNSLDAAAEPGWSNAQLGDDDYNFLRRLIYERSRINLGADKRVLVASRLAKRLRHLGLENYHAYCELMRSPQGAEELQFLIDRISTNHTNFFREIKHFEFLEKKFLPAWRAHHAAKSQPLRVWSAASSTGEEPYTIAIHLAEHLAPAKAGAWQIEASDISTRVLEVAKRGIYESDRLKGISPEMLRKYFKKGLREWDGSFRVKDELRERVEFHHLNLLEPPYPFKKNFHVIFCRNVMIYFDRATQESLVAHLTERLMPGGYLLVGHSESLSGINHSLQLVQPATYLKPAA